MKFNIIIVVTLLFTTAISSCKFTKVPAPTNQLITSTTFSSNSTATAAVLGIYTQMVNDNLPYRLALFTGYTSDELINYSFNSSYDQFFANAINPTNNTVSLNLWSDLYKYIYQANAIIEGINKSSKLDSQVKTQLLGEATFIRGFSYYYLVNLWGAVPILTQTDYRENSIAKRNEVNEVYKQIITDSKTAEILLNEKFVDKTDTTETLDRIRPTKWSARALLAKAYAETGDWVSAVSMSELILNNSTTFYLEELNDVFLNTSHEAIWQLTMPQPNSINTTEGAYFILSSAPTTGSTNCSAISKWLLQEFEEEDSRKNNWIDSTVDNDNKYYYPFKYKIASNSTVTENSTVFRLAEIYLIRAEGSALQGDLVKSLSDLNIIRRRAGLKNLSANTKDEIIKAIWHERQIELFCEWGHRWFDLKRTKQIDSKMALVTPEKGGVWKPEYQLFPIPQSEINSNPKLTQNIGY